VLEVTREVVGAEEGGEDVDVVGELEDFGAELDSFRVLVEGAEDGNAVSGEGVELNHVESACEKRRQGTRKEERWRREGDNDQRKEGE
jgi:hypothetical protein